MSLQGGRQLDADWMIELLGIPVSATQAQVRAAEPQGGARRGHRRPRLARLIARYQSYAANARGDTRLVGLNTPGATPALRVVNVHSTRYQSYAANARGDTRLVGLPDRGQC